MLHAGAHAALAAVDQIPAVQQRDSAADAEHGAHTDAATAGAAAATAPSLQMNGEGAIPEAEGDQANDGTAPVPSAALIQQERSARHSPHLPPQRVQPLFLANAAGEADAGAAPCMNGGQSNLAHDNDIGPSGSSFWIEPNTYAVPASGCAPSGHCETAAHTRQALGNRPPTCHGVVHFPALSCVCPLVSV